MPIKSEPFTIMVKKTEPISQTESILSQAEALFLSIGEGAIVTDKHGRISHINKVALDMLGYAKNDLVGEWFPGVIVAHDNKENPIELLDRPITRAILTGKTVTENAIYIKKSGEPLQVQVTVSPVMHNNKPFGAIEVFRDIRRELEVDKMKSEFISIASHQLRTPLSAVKMYSHMLSDGLVGELNTEQSKLLEHIIQAADRMNDLITNLLDLSKMEAGYMHVKTEELNVNELMNKAVQELMPAIKQKNIKLKVESCDDCKNIITDPLLIGEVFRNLLSNAIKYTPEGGRVSFTSKNQDGKIKFQVKDSGYGIPEHLHNHVFTKFFRAPNITNLDTTGSGLGLYMVKKIAENLDLDLSFKSKEGKGTTFTLIYCEE